MPVVRSGLRIHGWHGNCELAVSICEIIAIVTLADARLAGVGLLIRHSSAAGLVTWHKLWGSERLARAVAQRVEGRHDGWCRRGKEETSAGD